ncbi:MAG: hypothetical protein HY237_09325 [Acidobacteria bacterium]|nr:hypothetical protein [Acidobacteriota bacterium]
MRRHPFFRTLWIAANILFAASIFLVLYGLVREFSTRRYLRGFADAVVPLSGLPEQKVEAILTWMRQGPARRVSAEADSLSPRDPQNTLEYKRLLQVCGTATNAFVNLTHSAGLEARRLLLLDPHQRAKHVVAEVLLDGQWAVVDPAYRFLFRDARGKLLTAQQLRDPGTLGAATRKVNGYPPAYTFEVTTHIRLARVPVVGRPLQTLLDKMLPRWQEAFNWSLVLERESLAHTLAAGLLLCFSLAARSTLSWYGARRLGITRVRLREQLVRAGEALFSNPR